MMDHDATFATRALDCVLCTTGQSRELLQATDHREGVPGVFTLRQCTTCGLVRTDPIPVDLSPWYPDSYNIYSQQRSVSVRVTNAALATLTRDDISAATRWTLSRLASGGDPGGALAPGARVLDVGAGNGSAVAALRKAGLDAWGVEPSAAGVRSARDSGVPTVVHGTLATSGLADQHWDLIRFTHVLEHVADPIDELRCARNALRPGGRVAVLVPNFDALARRVFGRSWAGLEVPRHLWHFSPSPLRAAFQAAGFADVAIRGAALFGVTSASVDARIGGGRRQRGWGRSLPARLATYPVDLVLAALGVGDGLVAVGRQAHSDDPASAPATA